MHTLQHSYYDHFPSLRIMTPPQLSSNILFSQNSCTTSQDALPAFPHHLRRDRQSILVRQLNNFPANTIKASLMVSVDREMRTWSSGLMGPLKSLCPCEVLLLIQGVLQRSSHGWWCGQSFLIRWLFMLLYFLALASSGYDGSCGTHPPLMQ